MKKILKKTARSFYLTICLLPRELRESVCLAYLLARASDTIADGDQFSRNEEELLNLLPSLLLLLEKKELFEQQAINKIWQKILDGQLFELEFFDNAEEQKFFSREELDHYLYLVAGSVGEFWTELSDHFFKNIFSKPIEEMMVLGVAYGKGLQLINILRDRKEDEQRGRCYYESAQFLELCEQAACYLEQGKCYVRAITYRRLRYASALPVLLAEKTLRLILKNGNAEKMKVRRAAVYATLLRTLFCNY